MPPFLPFHYKNLHIFTRRIISPSWSAAPEPRVFLLNKRFYCDASTGTKNTFRKVARHTLSIFLTTIVLLSLFLPNLMEFFSRHFSLHIPVMHLNFYSFVDSAHIIAIFQPFKLMKIFRCHNFLSLWWNLDLYLFIYLPFFFGWWGVVELF